MGWEWGTPLRLGVFFFIYTVPLAPQVGVWVLKAHLPEIRRLGALFLVASLAFLTKVLHTKSKKMLVVRNSVELCLMCKDFCCSCFSQMLLKIQIQ